MSVSSATDGHSSPVSSTTANQNTTSKFRWKIGLFILALGLATGLITWNQFASDRSLQNFTQILTIMATMLLLAIWWTFFSGLPWTKRLAGWLLIILIGVGLRFSVRIVGYRGELVPIFAFRWQETAEERAAKYWERQQLIASDAATPSEDSSVDDSQAAEENQQPNAESAVDTDETPTITADDWPQFRGHDRSGTVTHVKLVVPQDGAGNEPKLLWRHPVGPGWSSFAVIGEFAITQEQQQEQEAIVCYHLETGQPVWFHADQTRFVEAIGGPGPRATPTIHDGLVYALGATGILNCLELRTGKPVWQRNILDDAQAENISWAMSSSPLIVDEKVIVNPGGQAGKSVIAYDRKTGEIVWARGEHPASYSSPILVTIDGVRQILLHDGHGATGINPDDGSEFWRFPWTTQPKVNAAIPKLLDGNRVLIGSGYGVGSAVLDLKRDQERWSATTDWTLRESRFLKPKFNDFIVRGKYVFGLDEGIMACVDLEERVQKWKRGRYGYGQMILIDDILVVLAESGEVVYVRANPEQHEELYRWQAIEGKTWNHPAFAHGKLLVRNGEEAACYDLPIVTGAEF